MPRFSRYLLRLLRRLIDLLLAPLREALIDLEGLSFSLRLLTVLGYVSVGGLLALTLAFELLAPQLRATTYSYTASSGEEVVKQVPGLVMLVGGLGFGLGWAYVLTGATDCRRRVLLPVAGLLAVQLFLILPAGNAMFAWCLTAPLFVGGVVAVYFFTRARRYWRDFPLVEFFVWFCALLFFGALFWVSHRSQEEAAGALSGLFSLFGLLNVPLWLAFGLGLVDMAVDLSGYVVTRLRRLFPGSFLRALTVFLILMRPAVALFIFAAEWEGTILSDALLLDAFLAAVPLLLLTVGLALAGRWHARSAATVLGLSIASPVFMLFMAPVVNGQDLSDLLQIILGKLGVFPPLLLFVLLMAHSVLSLGSSFADRDGRIMPRTGRVLLGFGFALLVTSFTIFSVNVRDASGALDQGFQTATDAFFGLGVLSLGPLYLLWILWKRRERLTGREADLAGVEPLFSWLERVPGRGWLVLAVVLPVLLACFVCLIGMFFLGPPPG